MATFYGRGLGDDPAAVSPNGKVGASGYDEQSVEDMLVDYQDRFCTFADAKIFITTFNVNGKAPPDYLHNWLVFDTEYLPDFVAVGLQEMDLALGTYVTDSSAREEHWMFVLRKNLPTEYVMVDSVRLVGIFLVVFHRKDSRIPRPTTSYTAFVATGFLRFGNKGGVGISLNIHNTSVCFVNCHLAAGSELARRNQDFREISQMRFDNGRGIYDHDVVFWFGDLNYRLDGPLAYDEVVRLIEAGDYLKLLPKDQLRIQQDRRDAFYGFVEESVLFRPTYKYDTGTSNWDTSEKRRVPAWCDRILRWSKDADHIKVNQIAYNSVDRVVFSDHKPVNGEFNLAAKIVDGVKRIKVYEELLRENDKKANDMLPQIELSATEFNFGLIYYRSAAIRTLTIKNTGRTGTSFYFAPTHQTDDMPENWLTVTPKSSFIARGSEVQVTLQVLVGDAEARKISVAGRSHIDLMCILIIKLDKGRDYFVVVDGKYQRSCFGSSFLDLRRSGARLPKDDDDLMFDAKPIADGDSRVPIQVYWLVTALRKVGLTEIKNDYTFSEDKMTKIRDALDNGRPQDLESQKGSHWSSMLYSALLVLLNSFRDPIFPRSLDVYTLIDDAACYEAIRKMDASNLQVMDFLLDFFVEMAEQNDEFKNGIQLLVNVLFQTEDTTPGNDERRRLITFCINLRRQNKSRHSTTSPQITPRPPPPPPVPPHKSAPGKL